MRNRPRNNTAEGFSLPSAYKSSTRQPEHLIATATLIASICVASIVGTQMWWS